MLLNFNKLRVKRFNDNFNETINYLINENVTTMK